MQNSKVATVAQRESISIGNIVLDANSMLTDAFYLIAVVAGAPKELCSWCIRPLIVACHADVIEGRDVQALLWQTIGWHDALVTAF